MQLSGFLPVIFIGLFLFFEVSAKENEERNHKPSGRRAARPRPARNNGLEPNNSSLELKKMSRRINYKKHMKAWLNPIDDVLFHQDTPVYSVKSTSRNFRPHIQEYPNIFRHLLTNLYKDIAHADSSKINNKPSNNSFTRPIPRQFKRPTIYVPKHNRFHKRNNQFQVAGQNNLSSLIPVPDTVYPEILVIVDYSLFKKFNRSVWELVTYLIGFWNGVDLRFRDLRHPRVRLSIAGILIAEDKNALSYIANHVDDTNNLFVSAALADKQKWLYQQRGYFPSTSYDIAMTMTKIKLGGPKGFATVGGACQVDEAEKKVRKTGIFNDLASYDAIMPAAHEVGHLLGINHDNDSHPKCGSRAGFMMAPILIPKKTSWGWSRCSQLDFYKFFKQGNGTCMYNKPKISVLMPRLLPGKLMDAKAQCNAAGLGPPINYDQMCDLLYCDDTNSTDFSRIVDYSPGDGAGCGLGRICLRGICREENSLTY